MNKKIESGALTEEDFELAYDQSQPIDITSIKELREIMGGICDKLNSDDWQHRVDNLRQIRGVFKGNQLSVDDYIQSLRYMDLELKSCVSDLRSQVVREACITVAYLSKELKIKIDSLVEQLLDNLLNLVPNGAKIMSSSGKIALKIIVYNVQTVKILQFFLTSVSTSKSTPIRQFSCEILKSICEKWPSKCLEKNAANISETLKKGINDADELARANSREACCWFNTKFPAIVDKLLQSLESNKLKILQRELSSFNNNCETEGPDSNAKTVKVPIFRQISASVSVSTKSNNGRPRINSAKYDYHSANSSTEYIYVKRQSSIGIRTVKPKIPTLETYVDTERSRISNTVLSQPASRDPSPSSRSSYITYTNGNASEASQLSSFSRQTIPSTYSSLRYKDVDTEIREKRHRTRKSSSDSYHSDDNFSETSSIISDHVPSFNELIVLMNSKMWIERKRGLNKAEKYIMECALKPNERKSLLEFFNAMFQENQTALIKKLLAVLHLFIERYYEDLNGSLYSLAGKLLNVHSNERLKSCKPDVNKILKLTIDCFSAPVVFMLCSKLLVDRTQDLTVKLKISALEYIKMTLTLAQPSLLDSKHSDIAKVLTDIVVMTTEKKSSDLRKIASNIIMKLFDLNSSQFSRILATLPISFQDRVTYIIDAHYKDNVNYGTNSSDVVGDPRSPIHKIGFDRASEYMKINTEALQTLSQNCDNVDGSSIVSNSSSRSGTYKKNPNYGTATQIKQDYLSKQMPHNSNSNNNNSSSTAQRYDYSHIPKHLPSQISHPDLSSDISNHNNTAHNLYPATSNDSSVDNQCNQDYYNSGPINASIMSRGDASSSNAELAPEYVMHEILKELSNHNERNEERKACLFKLIKIFRQNIPADWVEHFQTLLFLLLECMVDNNADIRALSLRVLQDLAKCQGSKFLDYAQLTILKVLEAYNDSDKSVIKAAEECSKMLTSTLPRQVCFKVLTDILFEGTKNPLCFASLKMLTKLIKIAERQCIESNLDHFSMALSIVVNHSESAVRKESILCLVEMHKCIGAEIFSRVTLTNSQKRLLGVYIEKSKE